MYSYKSDVLYSILYVLASIFILLFTGSLGFGQGTRHRSKGHMSLRDNWKYLLDTLHIRRKNIHMLKLMLKVCTLTHDLDKLLDVHLIM